MKSIIGYLTLFYIVLVISVLFDCFKQMGEVVSCDDYTMDFVFLLKTTGLLILPFALGFFFRHYNDGL